MLEVVLKKWITFDGVKFGMDTAGTLPGSAKGPMLITDRDRLLKDIKARRLDCQQQARRHSVRRLAYVWVETPRFEG
ncbi:MAG TPA: hypothetical protein QGF35_07195 [Dehalococcoidia bacterium]|nr:hypothetical protein [Dehalococcoidia bacterium]